MTTDKKKKNNKSKNDTTSKRPASSSPTGNVSGQGFSMSGPSNTPPSTTSTNKRTRVSADNSVMDVDKPLTPPGLVETTSAKIPSQPDTSSLDASQHAPTNNNDKGKSPEITPKEDLDKATASPMDFLFSLHFHAYDPQAIKADEHARTLVVTDIPLFITDALLRGTFSHYGNITRCHTCLSKLYRTAYITFESPGALHNLDSTWGVLCGGHCLRICPATFSPDQRAERRAYIALLAGLLRGTIAIDLAEIADEISAKSINVPFSMNSYNPKPYAYCHFASETAIENAKSISCALKKVGLTWHSPDEVTSLCHQCGRPNCNPDRCGSSSRLNRNFRPWQSNDKLRALYNKHLPPSHPAKRHNRFARPDNNNDGHRHTSASRHRSNSRPNNRQQSRSRSQRRPWNRDNLNNNNNNQCRRIPDANELDHYADGMDVTYPALLPRITKLESAMAARAPVPGLFVTKPPSYIPSSMQGWDDSVNPTNSNIHSPPLQSTYGSTPIPQFAPIPPSNVASSSSIDMEQHLSSLSDTVTSLAGSIKEGIQQNNLILARQNGQANH
ncbi:hypothetical protein RhiirC2_786134 [Rhizophagus irregularis]|uniref:RRM domain-containing protein n=1 Tax=Rhizophagus irregularis TaxID=588596 RepID=A0A2N1MUX1_9GLOM|nr:hypothetical protein RhiirC2_786134 [Rhizophagus irregularis]